MTQKTANKLLIVESPSKAKTIEKYLNHEYRVLASVGHIRDLPKSNKNAIDVAGGFIPHYEIIKGKGVEVCEVCLENLRRQSVEEAVCDRKYAADLGLSTPEWTPLDLREHADLFNRAYKLIGLGNEFAHSAEFDDPKILQEYLQGGPARRRLPTVVMAVTDVDIDRDGQPDHLLRYEEGKCMKMFEGFQYFYESALLALNDDRRTVDYAKTDLLIQHQDKGAKFRVGSPDYQLYQVFIYKSLVYFDKWDGGGGSTRPRPDTNTLSVYRVMKTGTEKVCQIRLFPVEAVPHN